MKKSLLLAFFTALFLANLSAQSPAVCLSAAVTPADDCVNACVSCNINGYQGSTAGFSAGDAPLFCGAIDNEQWIGFVAASSTSTITVSPSNCIDNKGLEIAIYQQCGAMPLVCSVGQTGNSPVSVNVPTAPGQSYYLVVDGKDGDECDFSISATNTMAPPLGSSGVLQGPTSVSPFGMATYSIAAVSGAAFYTWNGPQGSKINGQNTPVQIAAPGGNQVTVTFNGNSGNICVTPANPCNSGTAVCKNVALFSPLGPVCASNEPPADNCSEVCTICNLTGFSGSNAGYSPGFAAGFCGTIENEQWVSFVAGETETTIMLATTNCIFGNGAQLAIYDSCNGMPLDNGCDGGCAGCSNIPISVTVALTPGQQYFLMIDGYAGDECDFKVSISPPSSVIAPSIGVTGPILGPTNVCSGGTIEYSVAPVSGAGAYIWTAPPGSTINGQPSPLIVQGPGSNSVLISFGNAGGQVCVQPANACNTGSIGCKTVALMPLPPTVLPPVKVCNEDLPYVLPWGIPVSFSGTYQYTLESSTGCDSIVKQQVTVTVLTLAIDNGELNCTDTTLELSVMTNLSDPIFSWSGPGGFTSSLQNPEISEPGTYTLTVADQTSGCEISASASVVENTQAPVLDYSDGALNCTTPLLTINGSAEATMPVFEWSGPSMFTSSVQNPEISEPGIYILNVTDEANGCTANTMVDISGDFIVPDLSAEGDTLTCMMPLVMLHSASLTDSLVFQWSGPAGFISTEQNPFVSQPGVYTVSVTALNGCTNVETVLVFSTPLVIPSIQIFASPFTCAASVQTIQLLTNAMMPSYSWLGPAGFSSIVQDPEVSEAGVYSVTVTDGVSGCMSIGTLLITEDIAPPNVNASVSGILTCEIMSVLLDGSSTTSGVSFQWFGGVFPVNLEDVTVSAAGAYTLVATAPNGCTDTVQVIVEENVNPPVITLVEITDDQDGQGLGAINISVNDGEPPYEIHWFFNGALISDSEDLDSIPAGQYTVVVAGANFCSDTFLVTVGNIVATKEPLASSQWTVFPNPTQRFLQVQYLGSDKPDARLSIMDATGRTLLENNSKGNDMITLDIGQLPPGAYELLIRTHEGILTKIITIQR